MKDWLRGKRGGLVAFALIAGLVAGGLGWATAAALGLEQEQLEQRALAEHADRLRLALWRLDGLIAPHLAREDSRAFNHYSALFAPNLAFRAGLAECCPGEVVEPSPLLGADLPAWMRLHFQVDAAGGWASPQVPPAELARRLGQQREHLSLANVTDERRVLLERVRADLPVAGVVDAARARAQPATMRDTTLLIVRQIQDPYQAANPPPGQQAQQGARSEYITRAGTQGKSRNDQQPQRMNKDAAINSVVDNGSNWMNPSAAGPAASAEVLVSLSPLVPVWLAGKGGDDWLVVLRLVRVEDREVCQGIVLDVPALEGLLLREVEDLFPQARLRPMHERVPPSPERTMTTLPLELDPGEEPSAAPAGWTPLRVGLASAWAAAGVALVAVALGGWSLIDLSERRIRFVSAVTHELRTPLTTLRLYLDMLVGGLVRDEGRRREYLRTLHAEADRLNRLVGNVLDFSRLENQRPRLARARVGVGDLLAQVRVTWEGRCQDAAKEFIVEDALAAGATLWTDGALVQQVLGNLIDNACKYSRGAEDPRLWLRARAAGGRVVFEVEDRGPGVPVPERRSVFRAFRRGRSTDVTAGGVGLGLALARRWAALLGGRLTLAEAPPAGGACFRLTLPAGTGQPGQAAS
jgi:signal transduction histidine kinase